MRPCQAGAAARGVWRGWQHRAALGRGEGPRGLRAAAAPGRRALGAAQRGRRLRSPLQRRTLSQPSRQPSFVDWSTGDCAESRRSVAQANGQLAATRVLLSFGAEHRRPDFGDETPYSAALRRDHTPVAKLIQHFALAREMVSTLATLSAMSLISGRVRTNILTALLAVSGLLAERSALARRGLEPSRPDRPSQRGRAGRGEHHTRRRPADARGTRRGWSGVSNGAAG